MAAAEPSPSEPAPSGVPIPRDCRLLPPPSRAHGPGVSTPARTRLVLVPGWRSGGGIQRGGPGVLARAAAAEAACAPWRGWRWPEQRECDEAALPRCSARSQLTEPALSTPGGERRGRDLGRGGKRRELEGRRRRHPKSRGPTARSPRPAPAGAMVSRNRAPGQAGTLRTPRSTVLKLLPGAAGASVWGKAACHLLPPGARAEQDELGLRFLCSSG